MSRSTPHTVLLLFLLLAPIFPASALAGTVEGNVALPPTGVEEPPLQYPGFVGRIQNPVIDRRAYDPRPLCFVYLAGGKADDSAKKPPHHAVTLELGLTTFDPGILPVVVGSTVDIKNTTKVTHDLYSPNASNVLAPDSIGPGGVRSAKITKPFAAVDLASRSAPHLQGRIVGVPTGYFSRLDRDGNFKITGVPAGKWTVKVWCMDGWVPARAEADVGSKAAKVRLTLPETINTSPAKKRGTGAKRSSK